MNLRAAIFKSAKQSRISVAAKSKKWDCGGTKLKSPPWRVNINGHPSVNNFLRMQEKAFCKHAGCLSVSLRVFCVAQAARGRIIRRDLNTKARYIKCNYFIICQNSSKMFILMRKILFSVFKHLSNKTGNTIENSINRKIFTSAGLRILYKIWLKFVVNARTPFSLKCTDS